MLTCFVLAELLATDRDVHWRTTKSSRWLVGDAPSRTITAACVRGSATPMDFEWAKDGRTGELFILQGRPETVHARADVHMLEHIPTSPHGLCRPMCDR